MGIVNLTPDSFSDGNDHNSFELALGHIYQLISEKAHIIDIGAESTRPNATKIDAQTEISRLQKISIAHIKESLTDKNIFFSIDTYKSETARFALDDGYDIINDISGLIADNNMASVVADYGCGLIIMANQTLHHHHATDIITNVRVNFEKSLEKALKAGIHHQQICLDIGIGFGTTPLDNIALLQNIHIFKKLGFPVLVGASRKSFIDKFLNIPNPKDRDIPSVASHYHAVKNGADIIRVHDIKAHKEFFSMLEILNTQSLSSIDSHYLRKNVG